MSNDQTRQARVDGSPTGRIAVLIVLLVAVALITVACSGPPSAAGLASPSPAALEPGPAPSPSADGSVLPSASASQTPSARPSAKPTPKPTPRPTPSPTPNTRPAIASYQVPSTADCGGYTDVVQIQITWIVKRATGVTISIDGPGIYDSYSGTSGLAMLPFACGAGNTKHTYTLRTTGGTGPAAKLTKTVKRTG